MSGSPALTAHLILEEAGLWEAPLFGGLMSGLDIFFRLGRWGIHHHLNTLFVPTTEESTRAEGSTPTPWLNSPWL